MSINLSLFRQVSRSGDSPSNVNTVLRCWGAVSYISGHLVHFEPCLGKPGFRVLSPVAETSGRHGSGGAMIGGDEGNWA